MRAGRHAVVALVLATVTACGSTVQVRGTVAGGTGGGDGAGQELGAGTGTGTAASSTTGASPGGSTGTIGSQPGGSVGMGGHSSTGGAVGAGTTGTSGGTSGSTSGTSAASPAIPEQGSGWTKSTVTIGVMTQQDVQKVAASFGINNVDSGDQAGDVNAIVKELNLKGGLFGRKIALDIYDINSAGNPETQGQAACSHFTTDVHVIAVYAMALVGDTPSFRSCMLKARLPVLAGGGQAFDDKVFNELQGYYSLMPFPSYNRLVGPFLDRLKAQNYYTGWDTTSGAPGVAPVKTGFLCPDTPIGRRVGDLVRKASVRIGQPLASETYYSASGGDASAYVLRFKSDGITHVLFCDLPLFVFAQQAESQHYRPRYGISTFNTPVLFLQGVVANAQLVGSVGVGWAPTLDVDEQHESSVLPDGAAACKALAQRGGVSYNSQRRFAQAVLYDSCDILSLFVNAAKAAGGLDGTAIRNGIGLAGPRLASAVTFRSGLSASQHANPAATRDISFVDACNCYQYRGPVVPMG